jgi:hypothetical protein
VGTGILACGLSACSLSARALSGWLWMDRAVSTESTYISCGINIIEPDPFSQPFAVLLHRTGPRVGFTLKRNGKSEPKRCTTFSPRASGCFSSHDFSEMDPGPKTREGPFGWVPILHRISACITCSSKQHAMEKGRLYCFVLPLTIAPRMAYEDPPLHLRLQLKKQPARRWKFVGSMWCTSKNDHSTV